MKNKNYNTNYTDSFLSNKAKNYSKLIYQDINVDNLEDISDHQNHMENDNIDDFSDFSNMYFGTENYTVITSQIGSTALVPCSVHHIGEGMVRFFYLFLSQFYVF